MQALFGCWSSVSRKAVLPVLEKYNIPLYYPVQYEGFEESLYVFYIGSTANQQILPIINDFTINFLNLNQYYLIGSDYIFPRTANNIIKQQTKYLKGSIVGENYVPLNYNGSFSDIIADIIDKQPQVILNTLNGESNNNFFKELFNVRNKLNNCKVVSFSIAEPEVKAIGPEYVTGDYTCLNYYNSLDTYESQKFINDYKLNFPSSIPSDPAECGYSSIYLWYKSICAANSTDLIDIKKILSSIYFNAPSGLIRFYPNQHTGNVARFGEIKEDGSITQIYESEKIIPDPFLKTYPWINPNYFDL